MVKTSTPELKRYLDKRLYMQLNGNRKITGTMRGFDVFMNVVIEDCVETCTDGTTKNIGSVVVRGNSIVVIEALERIPM